jgi:hypothetical protein
MIGSLGTTLTTSANTLPDDNQNCSALEEICESESTHGSATPLEAIAAVMAAVTMVLTEENACSYSEEQLTDLIATLVNSSLQVQTTTNVSRKPKKYNNSSDFTVSIVNNSNPGDATSSTIVGHIATLANDVAHIIAQPKDPRVIGERVTSMFATILRIVATAKNARRN